MQHTAPSAPAPGHGARHLRRKDLVRSHIGAALLAMLVASGAQTHAQSLPATTVERVDDAVVFRGRIDARAAAEFLDLLRDPKITRLVITSHGGLVSAALDMASAIHDRQLDVEVPSACYSSCANYIFPAGRYKLVGRLGAVGWHGNMAHVLHLQQTGQASWGPKAMDEARELARRETEFFGRIHVDGFVCWFAKLAPYNVEDFYQLSVKDMERFGIGHVVVSDLAPATPGQEGPRAIQVDWARLDASRPSVQPVP
jgi:hypothetical protein